MNAGHGDTGPEDDVFPRIPRAGAGPSESSKSDYRETIP